MPYIPDMLVFALTVWYCISVGLVYMCDSKLSFVADCSLTRLYVCNRSRLINVQVVATGYCFGNYAAKTALQQREVSARSMREIIA